MSLSAVSAALDELGAPDWTVIVERWSSEFLLWKMKGYAELRRERARQGDGDGGRITAGDLGLE